MDIINITLRIPYTGEYTKSEILTKIENFAKSLSSQKVSASEKKCYHPSMTDEQLDMALKNENSFDEHKHMELSDEQYSQLRRVHHPLAKGLEKWL